MIKYSCLTKLSTFLQHSPCCCNVALLSQILKRPLTRAGQAVVGAGTPLILLPSLGLTQTTESSINTAFTTSPYTCTHEHCCEAFSNSRNTYSKWTGRTKILRPKSQSERSSLLNKAAQFLISKKIKYVGIVQHLDSKHENYLKKYLAIKKIVVSSEFIHL